MIDLLERAHSGRDDQRPLGLAIVTQQIVISERRRGNLVAWRLELFDQIHRGFIPTGGEPHDVLARAVAVDFRVLVGTEFETPLEVAVREAKRTLARTRQFFCRVHHLDGPLLKLHGVATGRHSGVNQLLGRLETAIVIDADLSHHERRMIRSNLSFRDSYGLHGSFVPSPAWVDGGLRAQSVTEISLPNNAR